MDWALVIDKNRIALLRVVAMLFVLAGLEGGGTLTRQRRFRVLRFLRPAETAVRRLIVIAAHEMTTIHPPFGAWLYGLFPGEAHGRRPARAGDEAESADERIPAFSLSDPIKSFSFGRPARRPKGVPRITCIGLSEPRPLPPVPLPDDPVEAGSLVGRLKALKNALENIDAQALRLVRWQARRERAYSSPARLSPIRNGRPPGRRRRHVHDVDDILDDLHKLALHAIRPANTS